MADCEGFLTPITDAYTRECACTGRVALKAMNQQATEEKSDTNSAARQMLGMKGAALETDIWKIRVQLTKPVTWIPLIWGKGSRSSASELGQRSRSSVSLMHANPELASAD